MQRRHSITFYSPVVRMSNYVINDNHFVSLKRMKTTEIWLTPIVSQIK